MYLAGTRLNHSAKASCDKCPCILAIKLQVLIVIQHEQSHHCKQMSIGFGGHVSNPLASFLSPHNSLCCTTFKSTTLSCTPNIVSNAFVMKLKAPMKHLPRGFRHWQQMLHGIMEVCGALWLLYVQLHIPICFGGLSVAAHLLHEPTLDPQTESTAKPQ
ncbi:uncharacterized protein LOC103934630 isoform X2 [Pyrus x bretschneideri]|uniref:uncharacterized protein LOC103934630 isoform X2 n=1 Tax=Pyrus x bretschneideri TaxID=225117 RepID=UPI00202E6119|nr:uncharacterized protein LOC103934630 isoform X2 [Pyrus x bretschneideri]